MKKWSSGLVAAAVIAGGAACYPGGLFPVTNCVARGSRVRTPRGLRLIEELAVGDEVLCVDPERGTFERATITWVKSAERECVLLRFEGGSLTLTSDHPVYCPEKAEWAPAGDWALEKRSRLLDASGETPRVVEVSEVSTFAGVREVFDLTVDHALHNFVAEGVLVHNKEPMPPACGLRADGGTVHEFDACACPDGTESYMECVSADAGECRCDDVSDAGTDAGERDGGELDGGTSDGGTSDGGG